MTDWVLKHVLRAEKLGKRECKDMVMILCKQYSLALIILA